MFRAVQRASREAWLSAARYPRLTKLILDLQDQDARVSLFLISRQPERWSADFGASSERLEAIAARDADRATAITRRWHERLLAEIRQAIRRDEDGVRALLAEVGELPAETERAE